MTRCVYRPTRMKNGKRVRQRIYRLAYCLPGMKGKKYVSLQTSDKQVAERKADEFLRELQQEEAGVIPPKARREAVIRPLSKHIEDYASDLRSAGRDEGYVYTVEKRLLKLCVECGWKLIRDVTADSFQAWRAKQNKAAKTLKQYFDTATGLVKWLERNGRFSGNPLQHVSRIETRGREQRLRRAFSSAEMERLLAVAGPRRLGYLAAVFTGLRRGELRALEWGDLHLDVEHPFIAVRASTTKNHRKAAIPLHAQLAGELRNARPMDVEDGDVVFSKETLPSMWWMRRDLQAAGIPFEDGQGRRVDFHALRGSFNTNMARAKVDPHTRQQVMRHSDIRLTLDVYTDKTMLPIAEAIHSLPAFGEDATLCATNLDTSGHLASQRGTNGARLDEAEVPANERISRDLAQDDAEWRRDKIGCLTRTRTNKRLYLVATKRVPLLIFNDLQKSLSPQKTTIFDFHGTFWNFLGANPISLRHTCRRENA